MFGPPLWRANLPYIVIGLLDVFAIGLGMGVPVLAIVYGVVVGWWLIRRGPSVLPDAVPVLSGADGSRRALRTLLGQSAALATVSLSVLLVVWGPLAVAVLDSGFDAAGVGMPLILPTPRASLIAWLVLMIVVSPLLQFGATVGGGALALAVRARASSG